MTESMAANHKHGDRDRGEAGSSQRRAPEWADGLKQLYNSVVEEALPDSFKDLLDQLDAVDSDRGKSSATPSTHGGNIR